MKSGLGFWIGWRFYKARQANGFIGFISFASTAGIALGVAVLIIVLSAMNGFEHELEQRFLGVVPQAQLTAVDGALHDWQQMVSDADQFPGVVAAAPFIEMQGLVQKPGGFQGLKVVGINPQYEQKVSEISHFMSAKSWQSLESADSNHIVMGQSLLTKLGLKVGDSVALYMPNMATNDTKVSRLGAARSHRFVISGSYKLGGDIELTTAYIPMAYASKILHLNGAATGVRIKVDDVFDAPRIIRDLGYTQKQYLYMNDWTRTQGHLYQDIQLVRMVMYIVLALVIAVACFNIVSTLVMAVRDKVSEIAILMTMGLQRLAIMLIFIVQGALNGLLGCTIGGAVGVAVALNLTAIADGIERLFGVTLLSGDIYFIDFLPSQLHIEDVVIVVTMAFIMSLIATIYPAFKASKTLPARALAG